MDGSQRFYFGQFHFFHFFLCLFKSFLITEVKDFLPLTLLITLLGDFVTFFGLKFILTIGLFLMTRFSGTFSGDNFFFDNHLSGGRGIVAGFKQEAITEVGDWGVEVEISLEEADDSGKAGGSE